MKTFIAKLRSLVKPRCPWREDTFRDTSAKRRWVCSKCHVSVYQTGDAPPDGCHRHKREVR